MPASPTRLPRSWAGRRDVLGADRHDRRERPLHDRGDRHQRQALVAGEQHLGLVGDRGVDLARGQQLERVGRVGRHLDVHVEARLGEVALGERLVDPDVVGVREPVEHQRELLRAARRPRHRLLLLAASGGGKASSAAASADDEQSGERAPHAGTLLAGAVGPRQREPLGERQQREQRDREQRQDHHRGDGARGEQLRLGDRGSRSRGRSSSRCTRRTRHRSPTPRPRSSPP